jgi:hypothetical protein
MKMYKRGFAVVRTYMYIGIVIDGDYYEVVSMKTALCSHERRHFLVDVTENFLFGLPHPL